MGKEIHFSLVVLCYRAEEAIKPFVESLHSALSRLDFTWELILVANYIEGSSDRTPSVAQSLTDNLPHVRCVCEPKAGMMGWDLRKGLELAGGAYIGFIDGDGQFPIDSVFSCLTLIETTKSDLVKTYRVRRDDGFYRNLISSVYNALFSVLFGGGLRDINSKPKIMTRSVYKLLALESKDWFIDAEIIIKSKQLGLKIAEVPTHFYAHVDRGSFVKPSAIYEFIRNLIHARLTLKNMLKKIK